MEACRTFRQQVLETFAPMGKLQRMPARQSKRLVLLEEFALLLEPGRAYAEAELNALLAPIYPDYCTVRREMVDAGLLSRNGMVYHVIGEGHGPSWLKPRGEAPPRTGDAAGVYAIVHLPSGRAFVGRGGGVERRLLSQRAQLDLGGHRCAALQEEGRTQGAEAFRFTVLALLDAVEGESAFQRGRRLAELEARCVAALGNVPRFA
jgi:hypothetical protein